MTVCPHCNHRVYDEILTICPYCLEDVTISTKKQEDDTTIDGTSIKREKLMKSTRSGDNTAQNYLNFISIYQIGAVSISIILSFVMCTLLHRFVDFRIVVTFEMSALFAIYVWGVDKKMMGQMAKDAHTATQVNLLILELLEKKQDPIESQSTLPENSSGLTEAEKQEFLSDKTISEIHNEINLIETKSEITVLAQKLDELETMIETMPSVVKSSFVTQRNSAKKLYASRLEQAIKSIVPLEKEIMGFYEQFLKMVDARKNAAQPNVTGRRRRQQ